MKKALVGLALVATLLASGCVTYRVAEVEDSVKEPDYSPKPTQEQDTARQEATSTAPELEWQRARQCADAQEAAYQAGQGAELYASREVLGEEFSRVVNAMEKVYQEMLDAAVTKEEIRSVHDWRYTQSKKIDEGVGAAYLEVSDAYFLGLIAYEDRHPCDVRAAATSTIRLGTGICLLTERDPIVAAKEAASLDLLSGGRFELAIGAG